MEPMDTTQIERLISDLEHVDPAEAPALADEVADALTDALESKAEATEEQD